ncbi:MAG: rhodanese-like domain-containing protein [Rhodospirillales bacterium]|nr:rhodanese-like domain-containing protein [Rhodospirillales bacterium]
MVENVAPTDVWELLLGDPDAVLVDVRTDAEWSYVGLPDLAAAGKQPLLISWQAFPAMAVNPNFVAQMAEAGLTPEQRVFYLCRSGVRSLAAARAAIEAGYVRSYNIADGFEGPPDEDGHRGTVAGWKAEGLPWRQR